MNTPFRWIHTFALLLCGGALLAQEVCNNGVDDDGDDLIDLNDPDCPCSAMVIGDGVASYIRNHSFEDRMCCPYGFVAAYGMSPPWLSCASGWQQATDATSDYFNECGYSPVGMNLPPPDGDGAVGFFAMPGYFEYVGTCLTYPAPANPLIAGTTYTLSLWISTAAVNGTHSQPLSQADPSYFTEQLPLAIFGYANACVPFPINTMDCITLQPGWMELGRVMVQPAWDWTRVSITFTPTQDIHSVMIGGGCDAPASFSDLSITNSLGETYVASAYFLVDDLMLTVAGDQVLSPVSTSGTLCAGTATATAMPPAGATGYQWYHNGVAVVGQTGTTLNVAQTGLGGGTYVLANTFNGECLMGSSYVPPAIEPVARPSLGPLAGCGPLEVSFADTTSGATTVEWTLGDGTIRSDSAFTHAYAAPGSYDVRLTVRNLAGCTGDTLLADAITVHPGVEGHIAASPDPTDIEHPEVTLDAGGSQGDIVTWWWDLGVADPSMAVTPTATAAFPAEAGEYPVMLVVTNAFGCTDTVRSVVVIIEPGVIEMPNVFSPNGDGRNDRFIPLDYNGTPGLLEIYNRWGQMIFSTRSLAQGWSGSGAPDGTYFYTVTADDPEQEKRTGHVTLVR